MHFSLTMEQAFTAKTQSEIVKDGQLIGDKASRLKLLRSYLRDQSSSFEWWVSVVPMVTQPFLA